MNTWLSALLALETGGEIENVFSKFNPVQFVKKSSRQCNVSEQKMVNQMLIQACELKKIDAFKYLVQWGSQNFKHWMPGAQHLCAEILYRPQGCALEALHYIIKNTNKFAKDQQEKEGFPLTTAIYTGNDKIWDGLTQAFPQSFHPQRVIQAIILSEEKKGVEWFLTHEKCQNLDDQFYFNLLHFVCTHHSEFGENVVKLCHNKIMQSLKNTFTTTNAFEFHLAHRHCRVTQLGWEDDLSHVLWVCNEKGGALLLEYLSRFISCPQHLEHMMKIAQFDQAELVHMYVNDFEFEEIIANIPENLLDKTAKTSKLYARFMNKRLHQAICSYTHGATDQVVRRM